MMRVLAYTSLRFAYAMRIDLNKLSWLLVTIDRLLPDADRLPSQEGAP